LSRDYKNPFKGDLKQLRFVEEYIIDFNATRAYQRAGFTAKTDGVCATQACRMLKDPKIKNKIRELVSERTFRNKISIDRTLREIAYMALSDPADVFDLSADTLTLLPLREIPEYARRAIQSISFKIKAGVPETTIKFWDKNQALDKLMRHMGQYAADKEILMKKRRYRNSYKREQPHRLNNMLRDPKSRNNPACQRSPTNPRNPTNPTNPRNLRSQRSNRPTRVMT
jgi:phage terminase small subunit